MNGYLFIERETEGRMSRESDDMTVRQRIVVYKMNGCDDFIERWRELGLERGRKGGKEW